MNRRYLDDRLTRLRQVFIVPAQTAVINRPDWPTYVDRLGESYQHEMDNGEVRVIDDLMDRNNPLWAGRIIVETPSGKLGLVNRIASRTFLVQSLRKIVGLTEPSQEGEMTGDVDDAHPEAATAQ